MAGEVESEKPLPKKSLQEASLPSRTSSLGDVERTDDPVFDSNSSKYMSQNYRRAAGATYVLAMGVCGIVLVALASSLKSLASQVDKTSIEIGSVFLTWGVGAALGNLVSLKLYKWMRGNIVVSVSLFLLATTLLTMPLSEQVGMLHVEFLALGFLAAIIDSGCQLMTRRLHGSAAGPWLGANTVSFGVSGALSPVIALLTGSLMVQYSVLAAVAFTVGFSLVVLPGPDVQPAPHEEHIQLEPFVLPEGWSRPRAFYNANKIDFHLCGIMFWFMGGRIALTAFLRQFADDTSTTPNPLILVVFVWLAITLGRVVGLRDQLTLALSRLYPHLVIVCIGGALAMLGLLLFSRSGWALWATVVMYGVFNGPALGYGFDLSTRISPNPATSATVAMFGITAGASIVPFLASFSWHVTGWALFLPLIVFASHVVPLVLLRETKRLHGAVSSRRPPAADTGSSLGALTPTFGAPPSPTSAWSPTGSYFEEGEEEEGQKEEAGELRETNAGVEMS